MPKRPRIPKKAKKPKKEREAPGLPSSVEVRDLSQLGAFLRSLRRASGLTQAEAAGLCNVGRRFLIELEQGKVTASLGKALEVFRGFGLIWSLSRRGEGGRR
ncbi:MAG: helix-turn-helix transcriptional regulator [Planctomycetes bacterium]|nr:helix-turn-helix transcriptional regulator [Planctomycetota bacterium]